MKARRILKSLCKVLASVALLGSVAVVNTNQPAAVEAAKKAKKSTKKVAKKTSKKVSKKAAKKSTKKVAKKTTKKSAKKSVKKVAKKVTKKTAKKSAKKVVKKAAKPAKKATKKSTKKSTKKVVKKTSKKAVKKVAKKSSKKKTKKSVKKPSNNVAKKTTAPTNTVPKTTTPTNTTPKTTTPTNTTPKDSTTPANKDTNGSTKSDEKKTDADRYNPVLVPNAHISKPYGYLEYDSEYDENDYLKYSSHYLEMHNSEAEKIISNYTELPIYKVYYYTSNSRNSSNQAIPVGEHKTKLIVEYDDGSEDVVGPISLIVTPVEAQKHYPLKLKTKSIKIKAFRKETKDGWTIDWKLQDEIPIYSTDTDSTSEKRGFISFGKRCLISGDDAKKLFINGGDIEEACLATRTAIEEEWGLSVEMGMPVQDPSDPSVATYPSYDGKVVVFADHDGREALVDDISNLHFESSLRIMCLYKDNSVAVSDPVTVNWDLTQIPEIEEDEP